MVLDEYFGSWHSVFLGGEVHRSQAVLGMCVDVSRVLEQQSNHVCVTVLRRQVQRCKAVLHGTAEQPQSLDVIAHICLQCNLFASALTVGLLLS